jgi:hypothetical protein
MSVAVPRWPLRIAIDGGLPPSPNRRMAWQARRRIVKPLADAVIVQARAIGLPRPLERARVQFSLIHARAAARCR